MSVLQASVHTGEIRIYSVDRDHTVISEGKPREVPERLFI